MKIEFRKAKVEEADVLSDLAIRSKGYWGYSSVLLELWRKDLQIEVDYIQREIVRTIWLDGDLVGFFAIKRGDEDLLDHFWLDPSAIGKGIGRRALLEVESECRRLRIAEIVITSDPDAEGFYLHHGAIRVGEVESVPQNRWLPKLLFRIETSGQNQTVDRTAYL